MTHKIITFLGTAANPTTYDFGNQPVCASIFPEGLYRYLGKDFDQMLVFCTKEAEEATGALLTNINDNRILPKPITAGLTPDSIWEMFDTVVAELKAGDEVTLDITHGLRSIPFLVFLIAAVLKTAGQVTIKSIYYGAYDLRDAFGRAPVLDLSDFTSMVDWISAVGQFTNTGSATLLADCLIKAGCLEIATDLNDFSRAAQLCQPFTLFEKLSPLIDTLDKEKDLPVPFRILREDIIREFKKFMISNKNDVGEFLRAEYKLLEWYQSKSLFLQAAILSVEFIIDLVVYCLENKVERDYRNRFRLSRQLDQIGKIGQYIPEQNKNYLYNDMGDDAKVLYDKLQIKNLGEECTRLWPFANNIRNALAHAEHREEGQYLEVNDAIKSLQDDVIPSLKNFYESLVPNSENAVGGMP